MKYYEDCPQFMDNHLVRPKFLWAYLHTAFSDKAPYFNKVIFKISIM